MDQTLLLSFSEIENAHWWFSVRRKIVEQAIPSDIPETTRVLEVGCGTVYFLKRLTERFPHATVTGVEPSEAAVLVARERGCSVSCGTLEAIPSDMNAPADLLVALDVLEHCEDDGAALRGAAAAMAPGARLVMTVPALPSLWSTHDEANHHYRRYTARQLTEVLESAGFQISRVTYFNLLLLPVGYATRLIERLTRTRALTGVEMPARWLNTLLARVFSLEVPLLRRMDLPLGMSLLAVARKPE
ncbi:MAG: methyltransferase domain-containing protein [Coriobacteriia bacterium]|nr:methyltransferase domain-containing protein [Coriobacteriia bacterium]